MNSNPNSPPAIGVRQRLIIFQCSAIFETLFFVYILFCANCLPGKQFIFVLFWFAYLQLSYLLVRHMPSCSAALFFILVYLPHIAVSLYWHVQTSAPENYHSANIFTLLSLLKASFLGGLAACLCRRRPGACS